MRATLLAAWLAAALALHLVAHVSLLVGLARRRPRWRAAAALAVPPLAPMWGWGEGMERRTLAWAAGVAAYAAGVLLAR